MIRGKFLKGAGPPHASRFSRPPAANDVLQRWPVSRRVNSSRAPADDPSLIEPIKAP
jgi:hypothetical protein